MTERRYHHTPKPKTERRLTDKHKYTSLGYREDPPPFPPARVRPNVIQEHQHHRHFKPPRFVRRSLSSGRGAGERGGHVVDPQQSPIRALRSLVRSTSSSSTIHYRLSVGRICVERRVVCRLPTYIFSQWSVPFFHLSSLHTWVYSTPFSHGSVNAGPSVHSRRSTSTHNLSPRRRLVVLLPGLVHSISHNLHRPSDLHRSMGIAPPLQSHSRSQRQSAFNTRCLLPSRSQRLEY